MTCDNAIEKLRNQVHTEQLDGGDLRWIAEESYQIVEHILVWLVSFFVHLVDSLSSFVVLHKRKLLVCTVVSLGVACILLNFQ